MYAKVCDCPEKFLNEFINTNYWITTTGLTYILEKIDTVQQSNAKSIELFIKLIHYLYPKKSSAATTRKT